MNKCSILYFVYSILLFHICREKQLALKINPEGALNEVRKTNMTAMIKSSYLLLLIPKICILLLVYIISCLLAHTLKLDRSSYENCPASRL